MVNIALRFFLNIFFNMNEIVIIINKIIIEARLNWKDDKFIYPIDFASKMSPVERIKPRTTLFIPKKANLTYLLSIIWVKNLAIKRMIIKEGRVTPIVATSEPRKPEWIEPI